MFAIKPAISSSLFTNPYIYGMRDFNRPEYVAMYARLELKYVSSPPAWLFLPSDNTHTHTHKQTHTQCMHVHTYTHTVLCTDLKTICIAIGILCESYVYNVSKKAWWTGQP